MDIALSSAHFFLRSIIWCLEETKQSSSEFSTKHACLFLQKQYRGKITQAIYGKLLYSTKERVVCMGGVSKICAEKTICLFVTVYLSKVCSANCSFKHSPSRTRPYDELSWIKFWFWIMACKRQARLKELIKVCISDKLFSQTLRSSVFETFLEILKNSGNREFRACFSRDTHERRHRHGKAIAKLLNSRKSLSVRKEFFLRSPPKFRHFVYYYLLKNFFENCVEVGEEEHHNH